MIHGELERTRYAAINKCLDTFCRRVSEITSKYSKMWRRMKSFKLLRDDDDEEEEEEVAIYLL